MRTSFQKFIATATTIFLALAGLVFTGSPAQAAIVLNANGVTLSFNENSQTVTSISGSGTGKTAGDVIKYAGVATISSTVVDCVIETVSTTGATISNYDGGSAISSAPAMFQSDVNTSGAGSVVYKYSFFVGGTYTAVNTGTPVILQNVYVNSYDLDYVSGNQFSEFKGFQTYNVSTNTTLACVVLDVRNC